MHRGHFKAVYPINTIHECSENVCLVCVGIANGMWFMASPAKPIPRLTINSFITEMGCVGRGYRTQCWLGGLLLLVSFSPHNVYTPASTGKPLVPLKVFVVYRSPFSRGISLWQNHVYLCREVLYSEVLVWGRTTCTFVERFFILRH